MNEIELSQHMSTDDVQNNTEPESSNKKITETDEEYTTRIGNEIEKCINDGEVGRAETLSFDEAFIRDPASVSVHMLLARLRTSGKNRDFTLYRLHLQAASGVLLSL